MSQYIIIMIELQTEECIKVLGWKSSTFLSLEFTIPRSVHCQAKSSFNQNVNVEAWMIWHFKNWVDDVIKLILADITNTTALSLESSIIIISNNYQELFDFGSHTFTKAVGIDIQRKDLVDRIQQYCSRRIRISWIVKSRTLWKKGAETKAAKLLSKPLSQRHRPLVHGGNQRLHASPTASNSRAGKGGERNLFVLIFKGKFSK